MKQCACGVDHWLHVALGFQGLVGMLVQLQQKDLKCSRAALEMLEKYRQQLGELVEKEKAKQCV